MEENDWANMEQVVVTITSPQGQSATHQGQWTRFSDYFSYTAGNATYNAAFVNSNEIQVQTPDGRLVTWTRGAKAATTPRSTTKGIDISGMWRSTSGSSVQVSTRGKQVFVTLIDSKGNRHEGSGRWLNGSSFDYSIPGFPGAATCRIVSDSRIDVAYGKTQNSWIR